MPKIEYKSYLLIVLTMILTFNSLDRIAMALVFDDIKADLQLSDTQLGLLGGIAFALFYAVMGIPIARWADRGNRVTIITATAIAWSVAVALCGVVGSFIELLLIRIIVAVGEAGCTPPANSLIAEYFTRSERPRAAAIYGLGGPVACVVGYFLAGWLSDLYGWRGMFMVLGAPGLGLAALAWFTLREPRRSKCPLRSASPSPHPRVPSQPSLMEVCATLWSIPTFRNVLFCLSVLSFFMWGLFQWQPTYIMRTFSLSSAQTGNWFALSYGCGGILGSYLGGALASRYAAQDESLQLRVLTLTMAVAGVLSFCIYLAPTYESAFALTGMYLLATMMANGPVFAMIQTLTPEHMRATSIALVYLFINLIGMGLGPLAAGVLSDAYRPLVGDESLRYALLTLTPGFVWVAWYPWRASKTALRDFAAARGGCDHVGGAEDEDCELAPAGNEAS